MDGGGCNKLHWRRATNIQSVMWYNHSIFCSKWCFCMSARARAHARNVHTTTHFSQHTQKKRHTKNHIAYIYDGRRVLCTNPVLSTFYVCCVCIVKYMLQCVHIYMHIFGPDIRDSLGWCTNGKTTTRRHQQRRRRRRQRRTHSSRKITWSVERPTADTALTQTDTHTRIYSDLFAHPVYNIPRELSVVHIQYMLYVIYCGGVCRVNVAVAICWRW